jgi:hypothetical protein
MRSLMRRFGNLANRALKPIGVELRGIIPPYTGERNDPIFARVKDITATSRERVFVLCDVLDHVVRNQIEGAFVECGVWQGGSSMVAALALLRAGAGDREMHLFDTFEGMPPPTHHDKVASSGDSALHEWKGKPFCYAPMEQVWKNVASTGYDMLRVRFHKGMVETTLPDQAPSKIAVLRLDTDWYESTKHELECLWPNVSPGGFVLIDDYGHFTGARKAVDEFFGGRTFLFRIDYSGRLVMKSNT